MSTTDGTDCTKRKQFNDLFPSHDLSDLRHICSLTAFNSAVKELLYNVKENIIYVHRREFLCACTEIDETYNPKYKHHWRVQNITDIVYLLRWRSAETLYETLDSIEIFLFQNGIRNDPLLRDINDCREKCEKK
jgi:hypothetical protein